ncbi:histone-like nucleoid-structuring protein Lsr2 [Streptosporangium lutulentum]
MSVLTGETRVPQFPSSLLEDPPTFTPASPVPALWEPVPFDSFPSAPVDTAAVRAWARENGYDVPSRGRVSPDILNAWADSHDH